MDDLTNEVFEKFSMEKRRPVKAKDVEWLVMDGLLKESESLYKEVKERQEKKKAERKTLKKAEPKKGKVFERWAS